jgi:hypothetical protein
MMIQERRDDVSVRVTHIKKQNMRTLFLEILSAGQVHVLGTSRDNIKMNAGNLSVRI